MNKKILNLVCFMFSIILCGSLFIGCSNTNTNEHTITQILICNGQEVSNKNVNYYDELTEPTLDTNFKKLYYLEGWYSNRNFTNKINFPKTFENGSIIYGKLIKYENLTLLKNCNSDTITNYFKSNGSTLYDTDSNEYYQIVSTINSNDTSYVKIAQWYPITNKFLVSYCCSTKTQINYENVTTEYTGGFCGILGTKFNDISFTGFYYSSSINTRTYNITGLLQVKYKYNITGVANNYLIPSSYNSFNYNVSQNSSGKEVNPYNWSKTCYEYLIKSFEFGNNIIKKINSNYELFS